MLYDAIYSYLESVGEGYHEDFVRAFFRLKVHDLGGLLPHVVEIIRKASHEHSRSLAEEVWQANEIVLVSFTSNGDTIVPPLIPSTDDPSVCSGSPRPE